MFSRAHSDLEKTPHVFGQLRCLQSSSPEPFSYLGLIVPLRYIEYGIDPDYNEILIYPIFHLLKGLKAVVTDAWVVLGAGVRSQTCGLSRPEGTDRRGSSCACTWFVCRKT